MAIAILDKMLLIKNILEKSDKISWYPQAVQGFDPINFHNAFFSTTFVP